MTARTVQRWVFAVLLALLAVLVFTGVWLTFAYRPDTAAAWNGVPGVEPAGFPIAQVVHRWSAQLSWLVAVGLMTVTLVRRVVERDRTQPWGLGVATVPLLLALSVTGYLLPFDQLAIWAVTVGRGFRGVLSAAFDDRVRFVLLDGVEVSQSTYRWWFLAHAVVLSLAVVTVAVLLAARLRAGRDVPPTSSGDRESA